MPRIFLSPVQPGYPELKPRLAAPAPAPAYVIPGSQYLDPPYSMQQNPCAPPWIDGQFPFPRMPWPFESETRAFGTGLISNSCQPCCPPPPSPQMASARRSWPTTTRWWR